MTFVIDHGEFTTNKIAGPARWTAPEILDPPEGGENEPPYSFQSDMFALAMTIVEVCFYVYIDIDFVPCSQLVL